MRLSFLNASQANEQVRYQRFFECTSLAAVQEKRLEFAAELRAPLTPPQFRSKLEGEE